MKCDYCNEQITSISYKTLNKKHFHKDCYVKYLKELEEKNKVQKEQSSRLINKDKTSQLQELEKFMCDKWNINSVPYLVSKHIDDMVNQNNYSYLGILQALIYYYDILDNPPYERPSVGIVPYVYDEAQRFYYEVDRVNANNKDREIVEHNVKVQIPKPKSNIVHCINIEDL